MKKVFRLCFGGIVLLLLSCISLHVAGQATVQTDKSDYKPGERVLLTGTNWLAGEQVSISIKEIPSDGPVMQYVAVADADGKFLMDQFVTKQQHLGKAFFVTAIGGTSRDTAGCHFTDASFTTVTSGNWNSPATWGLSGTPVEGVNYPGPNDNVTINGNYTVTLTANAAAQTVNISAANTSNGNTGLDLNGFQLNVQQYVTLISSQNNRTVSLTTGGGVLSLENLNLQTGSSGNTGSATFNLNANGILNVSGTITSSGAGNVFNIGNPSLINYTGGNQNIFTGLTYRNLTFSGTGTKTASAAFTANGTTTVAAGVTFAQGGGTFTSGGTVNVNGSFQLNQGGFATGGTWNYGTTGTLVFNNSSGAYGVNNDHAYWPVNNGPVNVTVQGSGGLNMNTSRTVNGIFQTSANVTGNALTLNGTIQINTGGGFTSSPFYGPISTLVYSVNGNYGRGNEWINTSGAGYPVNVRLRNNTQLNVANGTPGTARQIAGSLTIESGSGFYMDFGGDNMTQPVTVLGNVFLQGNLSLSQSSGGDLRLGGNWTNDGGNFNGANRAVIFIGAADQTVTRTAGAESFPVMVVSKPSGNVLLNNDLTITSTNLPNTLTFAAGNNAHIITGTHKVRINSQSAVAIVRNGNGHIDGNLERSIATGNNNYFYPVGTAGAYAPVSLDMNGVSNSNGFILARTDDGDEPSIGDATNLDADNSVNRFWTLTNNGVSFANYNIELSFPNADKDPGLNTATFIMGKLDNGTWTYPNVINRSSNSIRAGGLTGFSAFAAANPAAPPTVTTQPLAQTVCENVEVSFTATANAPQNSPITAQWQWAVAPYTSWTNVGASASGSPAYTSTYTFTPTLADNGKKFRVIFTNNKGTTTSQEVLLTVHAAPSITSQPLAATVTYGSNASFTVAVAGEGPLAYQWQVNDGSGFNNITLSGMYADTDANPATLEIAKPTVNMSGYSYRVLVSGTCAPAATSEVVVLTVNKLAASVTPNAASKTYGDADPALTGTLSGFLPADNVTAVYSRTAGETVAGSPYTISATLSPAGVLGNYDITYNNASFTINKRAATVTANNKSKTYGDVNPALDATVTGTVNGDELNYSLATTAVQFSNVGDYPITVTLGANPNYEVTANDGTLTIGKRAATVTANNKSKTYGDANPTLDATVTGTVNADVLNYSLTTTALQFSNVGTYPITVTLGANPNYEVTANDGTLTIGKRAATVTANNKSKTYGDANPTLDATVTGTVNADVLNYSLTTTALQFSNVGTYPITVTLGANPNYEVTANDGTLTIGKRAATVTANNKSKTYGDANPALDATVTGTVNDDVLNYSLATTAVQFSNVGDYPITVTLGVNPNYEVTVNNGTLTINKRAATVTANDKSKTYGDANPALDATVTGTVNGDVLNYSLSTTALQFSNVGDYPITVTLGTNPNYEVTANNGILTIGKRGATVTANNKSKTYGDANPALDATVTGTVNGDVLNYSLSTTALQFSNVGDYPITVTLGSNPNYEVTANDGTLTIGKRAATVTANNKSKTYGDANPALDATVTGTVNGDELNYSLATTAVQFSNVGDYPITVTLGVNPNYEVTANDGTLTIGKRAATVTANNKSKTYGDANPALDATVTGTVNADVLNYSLSTTAAQFSNVGDYPITVTLGSNPNYEVTANNGTLTIGKRAATVTANNKSKTYGDVNPTLDATVTGTVNDDVLNYSLSTTAAQFSNVGAYPITVTLGANPNYEVTANDGTLTIGKRAATVTANNKSKTYGDVNPTLDATVTGTVNDDVLNYSLATTALQFSNVGDYPITVTLGVNPNYEVTVNNGTLTIGKRAATVTANNKSKTYGDANPALDATVTGTVNADVLNYSLATTAVQFSNVGDYPITVTLGSNPNYEVTANDGTLTIGKRAATVTANNKSKTYGDANPALDATVTGTVNGDELIYSLATTAAQFSNVGTYPITVTLGANPNYEVTANDGTLTIGKRAATVTANNKSKTYGDANPTLDATVTGTVNADVLNYSLTTTALQFSNVGTYPITVTLGANPNYEVNAVNGILTIGKKTITVTPDNGQSKVFGAVNPVYAYTFTPALVGGDSFSGTLSRDAGENVGMYNITQGTLSLSANYTLTFVSGVQFAISPLPVTVTANAISKFCGQANPPLTFTSSPAVGTVLPNGQAISFTGALTRVPGESAGTYAILQGTLVNSNYAITYVGASFTINGVSVDASASSTPVPANTAATLRATVTPNVAGVPVTFTVTNETNATVFTATVMTSSTGLATATTGTLSTIGVLKVTAVAGSGCAESVAYLPVFDANDNFVTGGGWIESPAGAMPANPDAVGKANFGFVSRYRKGSNQVDGNTEFQFNAGGLNFKSTMHESGSLVISGGRATYRGTGTVNGVSGFRFVVVAIDGNWNNGTAPDRFRIKITNSSTGQVVYDNQMGKDENTADATVLGNNGTGGGSIVIHEAKRNNKARIDATPQHEAVVQPLEVKVLGNPSTTSFGLRLSGGNLNEKITIRITDINGRLVEVQQNLYSGQLLQLGGNYAPGVYFAEAIQGTERKVIKLVKAQ